jgi:ferritin-like metal-binding protein YciE
MASDAYAMEQGLVPILTTHAREARASMPDAAVRIEQHLGETQTHALRLQECLAELGASPSAVKAAFSATMGAIEGASTGLACEPHARQVRVPQRAVSNLRAR